MIEKNQEKEVDLGCCFHSAPKGSGYSRNIHHKTTDQMDELITLDKVVPYQWYPCGDENYWCEESDEYGDTFKDFVTLVSYKFDYSDAPSDKFVNMRHDCPYGWSTLAKMGAMFMIIKKPIFKEEVLKC